MTALSDLPQPRALVFDLDGTLVDTVDTRIDAWLETFEESGIAANRRQVAPLIGADGKKLAHEVAAAAAHKLSSEDAERIDRRSGEIYDRLNTDPRPLPGVRSFLASLSKAHLPWAIATSSRREQVAASVAALQLKAAPLIVDGTHVEHAKPAPDLLLLATERLSIVPADCWYVGDSTWDMLASRSAGMTAVGVAYGAATPRQLRDSGANAVTTFRSLSAEARRRGLTRA